MYKNKNGNRNNIAGLNVARIRKELKLSQQDLAVRLQNINHDIGKNGIQQMESGSRFITDIELKALSKVLSVSYDELLKSTENQVEYNSDESITGVKQIADNADDYSARVAFFLFAGLGLFLRLGNIPAEIIVQTSVFGFILDVFLLFDLKLLLLSDLRLRADVQRCVYRDLG